MIELVFSASPETVRKGASGVCLHRSIGRRQDLAVCALCDLDSFLLSLRFLCRGAAELSYWHEVSLLAVHCEQIGQEFACHRECGAIGIPFLFLPGVEQVGEFLSFRFNLPVCERESYQSRIRLEVF